MLLLTLWSELKFAILSLMYFLCQGIHVIKEGEEGLVCWVPHTENGSGLGQRLAWRCAHPGLQFLFEFGKKVHILEAYIRCFD